MEKYIYIFCSLLICHGAMAIRTLYMEDYCSGSTIDVGYYDQIRLKLTGGSSHSLNWQCQVLLNTDFDSQMMLYFKDMNIPSSYSCQYNFLEIDDGSSRSSPYIAVKLVSLPGGLIVVAFDTGLVRPVKKGEREKSREWNNHIPQHFADTERKRKQTKPNKRKSNKCGKLCGYSAPSGVYRTSGSYMTLYFQKDSSSQYDNFDIIITSFHTGVCDSWEYNCDNGRCIDNSLTCNGYNSCGDYSDCDSTAVTLTIGGIAGVVVGGIVVVTIIVVAIVLCRRRRTIIVNQTAPIGTATTTSYGGYNQPVPKQFAPPPYPGQTQQQGQYQNYS